MADLVGICTNGVLLAHVTDELLQGLDFIDVSLYPLGKKFFQNLENTAYKCKRLGIKFVIEKKNVFRLMNVDNPHDGELSSKTFCSCKIVNLWQCHVIHNGFFYKCSRPIFMSYYFAQKGITSSEDCRVRDGVDLHHPFLFERLKAYLADRKPFLSCSYCLGTSGKEVKWRLMGKLKERPKCLTEFFSQKESNRIAIQD